MKKKKSGKSNENSTSKKDLVIAKNKTADKSDKIIIYTDDKGNTELRADVEGETIWATQLQIAQLFDVNVRTVNEHLNNIYITNELKTDSTIRKFRIVQSEGGRKISRITNVYNLDAIIAVGYRVNSKMATQFRIWATSVLRDYVVSGYSLNRSVVAKSPEKIEGLQEAIALIESTDNPGKLKGKIIVKLTKNLEAD